MKGINWAGVIAAAIVGEVIGFLWYGMVFEQQWLALSGVTPPTEPDWALMGVGFLNTVLVAIGLGWLNARLGSNSLVAGATTGLLAAIFFAVTTGALAFIYGGANMGLIPIDIGYLLVGYTVMGAVAGAVKLDGGVKAAAA